MAHNYSTPDPLRLPSIRSLEIGVYPASNNTNNNASVDYVQQQQQQQHQYQSQVRYSEEYYPHSNREMGYYGHDASNTQAATTNATTTNGPISQAHPSTSGSGSNISPYRRPRTISSNLNNQVDNAKYRDAHIHHSSTSSPSAGSNNSGSGHSSTSISGANSGSLGTPGASGSSSIAPVAQPVGNQSHRSSSSYPSTYSGHPTYPDYYAQRGGAIATATVTATPTTTAAANPAGAGPWYYAQSQNTSQAQQQQQPASSPVVSTQQKSSSIQQYSHAASPLQSSVSVPSQQQQQYYHHHQPQTTSSYSQQQESTSHNSVPSQSQSQGAARTPRSQHMPPPSSSLHASGGMYPGTSAPAHHSHHMGVPSVNSSSSLAGGNGNTSTAVPTAPSTSINSLSHSLEEDASRAAADGTQLSMIIENCRILQTFADHYAQQTQNSNANATPSPSSTSTNSGPTSPEFSEMAQRANIVFKLVSQLRKEAGVAVNVPGYPTGGTGIGTAGADEDSMYKKKRGWDDDASANVGSNGEVDTLAHQDMALIRSKRAQGVGNNTTPGGNAKSKYRKRSRANPPGKCHSCNIQETPEWRRGPDGARTLCNACGLHYAKLIRKRDKTLGAGGVDLPPISVEMLRASTRADSAKHHVDIGGSITLSGIGPGSGVSSGNTGANATGTGVSTSGSGLGPSGSSASGSAHSGHGSNTGASDLTEITLQPVGAHTTSASTSSGVTLSPITTNSSGSLTGLGRSGGGGLHVHQWASPAHVYRYTGPDSTSSFAGGAGNSNKNGAGSSYHSHSHSSSGHSTTHSYSLPPPPHHHSLHLPHPLQRSSNNGYDGYSTSSLMRSSASVGGGGGNGDGRGSPGV